MTIGERIKKIRLEQGLTQKQVADSCGMADSAIRKYESGKVTPKYEMIQRIATALGVNPGELMGLEQIDRFTLAHEASPGRTKELADRLWGKHSPKASRTRVDAAMDQMSEEGRSKVADYAEDILPRYRATPAPQPPAGMGEGKDTTPPLEGTEGPGEGK